MTLPIRALPKDTVDIDDTPVEVTALSRASALRLSTAFTEEAMPKASVEERTTAAELFILMQGTGATREDAKAFYEGNDVDTAGLVIDRILELSGLAEPEKDKPDEDPKADGAKPS